jgi:two-component system OmpR family response regulator
MDARTRGTTFDLIVLDVMLPGEDGFSICRRLRAQSNIPILMLTAVNSDIDRIVGLEIGADDYVTKPFILRELTARIKGLLRRASLTPQKARPVRQLRFDGWKIDLIRRQMHDPSDARVALTTHEFDILVAFCRNPGRILTREELLTVTHAGLAGPIERSIDVHISRLRQKIEADPRDPALIKTVRLGGYLFTANVEEA